MKKPKIIIMIIASLIILMSLLLPPMFGKSDDGSFYNILKSNAIYRLDSSSEKNFNSLYGIMPQVSEKPFFPVSAAKSVNSLFSAELFDIRCLAVVYLPFYIAGMCLIIASVKSKNKYISLVISILAALILCDIGYISYFNSFYTDALYISAFTLLSGTLMFMLSNKKANIVCLILCVLAGVILSGSGAGSAVISVLAALIVARLCFVSKKRVLPILSAVIMLAGSILVCGTNPSYTNAEADAYNAVFEGAVKESEYAASELSALGIDASYSKFSNVSYYDALKDSDFDSADFSSKINNSKLLGYYLTHPSRAVFVLDSAAKNAPFLSQSYISNKADTSYGIKAEIGIWSYFRRFITPASLLIMLIFVIAVIVIVAKGLNKEPSFADFALFLIIAGVIYFAGPIVTGGLASISRRLVMHQISLDLTIIIAVTWIANTLLERRERLQKTYGVNQ